ncbi:hypothetical protein Taro_037713 [Colocasia esculenta]|uniref:PIFI-like Ig-like domain-containing protein n=1 Tax=Colocasia esculenta TaxID=4460 RepID=A0A843WAK3_COLES|nr:hypothetical protein [Colocasia esculenta]
MAAAPAASLLSSPSQRSLPLPVRCAKIVHRSSDRTIFSAPSAGSFLHGHLHICRPKKTFRRISQRINAVAVPALEETKECILPTWAEFDIGRAPVYWKTMNGLPPMSGEKLTLFYNPAASKLVPNNEFGIAFHGGFNQPIMCSAEPRAMTKKTRGKADPPIYTIKICIPKHAVNLIFSFTNGVDWDGPYKLQFQVLRRWQNKPIEFFNEVRFFSACFFFLFPSELIQHFWETPIS